MKPDAAALRAPSPAQRSDAINIARVICILGIVYAHARTGLTNAQMDALGFGFHGLSYWFLVEILGRSSVPLLSVISGWLVVSSFKKRGYRVFVLERVKNLLGPMAAWNLIALFLTAIAIVAVRHVPAAKGINLQVLGTIEPHGMALVNEIIHLMKFGLVNGQTAFLRDIFVCMLFAPLFARLSTRFLWAVVAGALVWAVGVWEFYIILRPQILAFFVLGIIARRGDVGETLRRVRPELLLLALVLIGGFKIWTEIQSESFQLDHPHLMALADNLLRFPVAAAFWRTALWLADSRLSRPLLWAEQYIFVTFCSHLVVIRMIYGPIQGKLFGNLGSLPWLASFIVQPLFAFAAAWAISLFLLRFSPAMAALLSGGRLTRAAPRPVRPQPAV